MLLVLSLRYLRTARPVASLVEDGLPRDVAWSGGGVTGDGSPLISRRLVEVRAREHKLWLCDIEGLDLKRSFALVQHKDKLVNLPLRQFREACFTHPFI